MAWVSTRVTPIGVAQADASNRAATSKPDRWSASANRDLVEILFAGLFMPAPI
jgi:hypothetical protein